MKYSEFILNIHEGLSKDTSIMKKREFWEDMYDKQTQLVDVIMKMIEVHNTYYNENWDFYVAPSDICLGTKDNLKFDKPFAKLEDFEITEEQIKNSKIRFGRFYFVNNRGTVPIRNRNNKEHVLQGVYQCMCLIVSDYHDTVSFESPCTFGPRLIRNKFTFLEFTQGYTHSHIVRVKFCKTPILDYENRFTQNTTNVDAYRKANCQINQSVRTNAVIPSTMCLGASALNISTQNLNSAVCFDKFNIEDIEIYGYAFLTSLSTFVEWESLDGGPHYTLDSLYNSVTSYQWHENYRNREVFSNMYNAIRRGNAKIHWDLIDYRIKDGHVEITNSEDLDEIIKDIDFDIFQVYNVSKLTNQIVTSSNMDDVYDNGLPENYRKGTTPMFYYKGEPVYLEVVNSNPDNDGLLSEQKYLVRELRPIMIKILEDVITESIIEKYAQKEEARVEEQL